MKCLLPAFFACCSVAVATTNERYIAVAGWTAETPGVSTQPPQVDIHEGRVFVNGAPIRLRGVTAPEGLTSVEAREQLILAWKRANVNALLVPAGIDPNNWLPLCDRLGLYVVVECGRPADGTASGDAAYSESESSFHRPSPATGHSDDCCRPGSPTGRSDHYCRPGPPPGRSDGLHPSYLFCTGSLATVSNPAPMQAFLQAGARLDGFDRPTLVNVALDTPRNRPIVAVDLAPSADALPLVWQEIYWHPRLLGAFLAPSVEATVDDVKKAYQPLLIEPRRMKPGDVAVRVTNRHHHLSLDAFEPRWVVLRDGEPLQQGMLPTLALAPNAQPEIPIPVGPIPAPEAGVAYTLRLSFHTRSASAWAPAGHEIAYEELPLDVAVPAPSSR